MAKANKTLMIPDELVLNKIYIIRGQKVMLDRDLSELYAVETKRLKEAVRRNIGRFPEDFMFEMSSEELENWRTQFATSNSEKMGLRHPPFCFTEQGVAMLSSVLNSETAILVNIRIIRVFTKMRELLLTHKDILLQLEKIEQKLTGQRNDQRYDQQYDQQYGQQNNQMDFDKGYDKERFIKETNDYFDRGNRYNDRFSMERKRDMMIERVNWEYDYKIQRIKRDFYMSWFEKQREIRFLENQRRWEISKIYEKCNSYDNRDRDRYHGRDDRNGGYDRNDRSNCHY